MRRLPFTKMSGAGNDFVLIDGSLARVPGPALARKLCARHSGVGADGLLIVRRKRNDVSATVDYFNADGSRAFCGNGTRCAAWWTHIRRWVPKRFLLGTISGAVAAEITGSERARVEVPLPKAIRWNLRLEAAGRKWTAHFIEVGVPHAVVEVERLESLSVIDIGRAIRNHRVFRPHGANVDFMVAPKTRKLHGSLSIRTYERGVEDETLACGSGVVASAYCVHALYGVSSPIRIAAHGGNILTAGFNSVQGRLVEAWLEGPARITFQGEVYI